MGFVGFQVADLLMRLGEEVTVISLEARQEFSAELLTRGAKILRADARVDQVLLDADVASADAVIACADSDIVNIEIGLDVHRLAPDVRIIARLFDQTLARRLEGTIGIHRALAMSALSAPTFALAAVGESLHGMFLWERQTYVVSGEGHADDEHTVSRGMPKVRAGRRRGSSLSDVWSAARDAWKQTPKLLRVVAYTIPVLTAISVLIFQVGLHLSPVDSLYFVITTVTTTGYGDISAKDASVAMKLYACLLMLIGSASVATLYSLITDFVVTSRFNELFGRRAVRSHEHVIVVGLGSVGFRIVETLCELGVHVAVVDLETDPALRKLLGPKVSFIAGDGRDEETLELAGIDTAQALIAATDDDAVNLSIGLSAHEQNKDARIIVRLFDADFARKVESTMGVDRALSASRLAAPGFVGAALYGDAVFCYEANASMYVIRPGTDGQLVTTTRKIDR